MAPETSLARLRKQVLDLVGRGEVSVVEACRRLGISRSRHDELRSRYLRYGEAGLLPKPRPPERRDRRLPAPLVDQIVAYAVEHPTEGPRTIAARLALPRFGAWRVSHGGVTGVLRRAGLGRRSARLAAAEALAASEGGPITERVLRDLRAREVTHRHLGSEVPGEQVFFDTMEVGKLKGVGKIWQYSAAGGACSFGFATARAGEKSAREAARFLEHHVLPAYAEAPDPAPGGGGGRGPGVPGGRSSGAALRLGIRLRRLPPRSPDLNAFVERLGHGPPPALPDRVPLPLLHEGRGHLSRPPGVPALLQLRAPPPRLQDQGTAPGGDLLRPRPRAPRDERMGCR